MKKIIVLLLPFLLTGCWNYRELNDMAIASAIAIKRENDKFVVSVQIMNSKKGSSSGSSSTGGDSTPISVLTAEGETIHEAIRNISLISPREVYIGHMDLLVLDEKIAYNGINEIIDFFMRDPESRKQFKVIISKNNDPGELIKILTPLENIPSKDLVAGLKTSNKIKSSIIEVIYDELLSNIYSEGFEAVLPVARVEGPVKEGEKTENVASSSPTTNIVVDSLAVLNGDVLVGYLSEHESIAYNFIVNNITYTIISFKCDDEHYASLEVVKSKTDSKVKIIDNEPVAKIKTNVTAFLSEINCRYDITTQSDTKKLSDLAEKHIESMMSEVINKATKQYGSDIFGFGQYLYRNNNSYWKEVRNNWPNLFRNIKYDIDIDIDINRKGSIIESSKEG